MLSKSRRILVALIAILGIAHVRSLKKNFNKLAVKKSNLLRVSSILVFYALAQTTEGLATAFECAIERLVSRMYSCVAFEVLQSVARLGTVSLVAGLK